MSIKVRIFRPSKNAMQSGRANTRLWALQFEPSSSQSIDPLMGWTSSSNVQSMLNLSFETKEEAISYAERKGLDFRIDEPKERKLQFKNYSENFSPNRLT